jgi:GDPmannose 4,6-dehydratase
MSKVNSKIEKKVIIVGVSGQDGRILAKLFSKNLWKTFGLSKKPISKVDLNHQVIRISWKGADKNELFQILDSVSPDLIINVAALNGNSNRLKEIEKDNPTELKIVTRDIPEFIIEWILRNRNVKFLTALSSLMYTPKNYGEFVSENTQINPQGLYGELKAQVFTNLKKIRAEHDLNVCGVIMFPHTSQYSNEGFLLQKIAKQFSETTSNYHNSILIDYPDQPIELGNAIDFCQCIYLLSSKPKLTDLVIATGSTFKLRNLMNEVLAIQSTKVNVRYRNENTIYPYLIGDVDKANKLLNWKPKISISQTFQDILHAL